MQVNVIGVQMGFDVTKFAIVSSKKLLKKFNLIKFKHLQCYDIADMQINTHTGKFKHAPQRRRLFPYSQPLYQIGFRAFHFLQITFICYKCF